MLSYKYVPVLYLEDSPVQLGPLRPDYRPERPLFLLRPGEESLQGHVQRQPLEANRLQEYSQQEGTTA